MSCVDIVYTFSLCCEELDQTVKITMGSTINKDSTINVRIHASQRDLIDRASAVMGKSRSEFMLESACEKAKDIILDQTFFQLDPEQYEQFLEILDRPCESDQALRTLLNTQAPWNEEWRLRLNLNLLIS